MSRILPHLLNGTAHLTWMFFSKQCPQICAWNSLIPHNFKHYLNISLLSTGSTFPEGGQMTCGQQQRYWTNVKNTEVQPWNLSSANKTVKEMQQLLSKERLKILLFVKSEHGTECDTTEERSLQLVRVCFKVNKMQYLSQSVKSSVLSLQIMLFQ